MVPLAGLGESPDILDIGSVVEVVVGPLVFGAGECVSEGDDGRTSGHPGRGGLSSHVCRRAFVVPPAGSSRVGGMVWLEGGVAGFIHGSVKELQGILEFRGSQRWLA